MSNDQIAAISPATDALRLYANNSSTAPVARGHPVYAYMRDSDGDGVVCEG